MKFKYLYLLTILALFLGSCEDKIEVEIEIPMSEIYLSAPADMGKVDLNDEFDKYDFAWKGVENTDYTIIFSMKSTLNPCAVINVGEKTSFSISIDELEDAFTQIGVKIGQNQNIYWSVKETENQHVAASDIRQIVATRLKNILLLPVDQSTLELNYITPNQTVEFNWDRNNESMDTEFVVVFSTTTDYAKSVKIDAGKIVSLNLTHSQLQEVFINLGTKKLFDPVKIYWNIQKKSDPKNLSRSSCSFILNPMMSFKDVRGTEEITYPVTRISYSNGKSFIWLAENLRATKYPDGTDIDPAHMLKDPEGFDEKAQLLFGIYYFDPIKYKIAPKGWRLPTKDEFVELFEEAAKAEGTWSVLKHKDFWAGISDRKNMNAWKLGLCPSGQSQDGSSFAYLDDSKCYLLVDHEEEWKCMLHDGGGELWWPWASKTPGRYILIE